MTSKKSAEKNSPRQLSLAQSLQRAFLWTTLSILSLVMAWHGISSWQNYQDRLNSWGLLESFSLSQVVSNFEESCRLDLIKASLGRLDSRPLLLRRPQGDFWQGPARLGKGEFYLPDAQRARGKLGAYINLRGKAYYVTQTPHEDGTLYLFTELSPQRLEPLKRGLLGELLLLDGPAVLASTLKDPSGRQLKPHFTRDFSARLAEPHSKKNLLASTDMLTANYAGFAYDDRVYAAPHGIFKAMLVGRPWLNPEGKAQGHWTLMLPREVMLTAFYRDMLSTLLASLLLCLGASLLARRAARRFIGPISFLLSRLLTLTEKVGGPNAVALQKSPNEIHMLHQATGRLEQALAWERHMAEQMEAERACSVYSAKMASLGEMAANVAHEINTPLAVISARAEQVVELLDERRQSEELRPLAASIAQTAQRIGRMVKGMLNFSRDSSQEEPRVVALAELIDEVTSYCGERFKAHGVRLIISRPRQDLSLRCQPTEVLQILLNLLNNAFDAVKTSHDKWVRLEWRLNGMQVEISIVDSGGGIAKDLSEKIFLPFFTTKGSGQGTGLGLSVSRRIAEAQGGKLSLDSSSPNTRFVLQMDCHGCGLAPAEATLASPKMANA